MPAKTWSWSTGSLLLVLHLLVVLYDWHDCRKFSWNPLFLSLSHTYTCTLKRQTPVHCSCIHPSSPRFASVRALWSVSSFFFFCKKKKTGRTNIPSVYACLCVCVCTVHSGLYISKLQTGLLKTTSCHAVYSDTHTSVL